MVTNIERLFNKQDRQENIIFITEKDTEVAKMISEEHHKNSKLVAKQVVLFSGGETRVYAENQVELIGILKRMEHDSFWEDLNEAIINCDYEDGIEIDINDDLKCVVNGFSNKEELLGNIDMSKNRWLQTIENTRKNLLNGD